MRRIDRVLVATVAALLTQLALGQTGASGQSQDVAVAGPDINYVVSPHGQHVAAVVHKGSRLVVTVDGVAGPKFDEVTTPVAGVDLREDVLNAAKKISNPKHQVTFSDDGKHYAYIGRQDQEWVLIVDGKETLRLPKAGGVGATGGIAGSGGNTDLRLQFAGHEGKHFLFAKSTISGGYELWVDGQKWPGTYNSGSGQQGVIDPLISPDAEHVAMIATIAPNKSEILLDGKPTGYNGDNIQFSPDSKHLLCIAHNPKVGDALLVDGKPFFSARMIYSFFLSPAEHHLIAVLDHKAANGAAGGMFLLVDKKPVEDSLSTSLDNVVFSPDGKHYAAVCGQPNISEFVVIDGKKQQKYNSIDHNSLAYSADSSKCAYIATNAGKSFLVVNDDESDAYDGNVSYVFDDTGKHLAVLGMRAGQFPITIDGKTENIDRAVKMNTFTWAGGGSHHAYTVGIADPGTTAADGKSTGIVGTFLYSPDGSHLACFGWRDGDNKGGVFLDGQLVHPVADNHGVRHMAFSPDGQHLAWMLMEPDTRTGAAPNSYDFGVYVDGKPVTKVDSNPIFEAIIGISSVDKVHSWETWGFTDGALSFIAPVGDSVKRFTVPMPADTNLSTMAKDAAAAAAAPPKTPAPRKR